MTASSIIILVLIVIVALAIMKFVVKVVAKIVAALIIVAVILYMLFFWKQRKYYHQVHTELLITGTVLHLFLTEYKRSKKYRIGFSSLC